MTDQDGAVRRVLIVTLGLNLVVAAAKVAYGVAADSLAIRSDGWHSVSDSLNNLVALTALKLAAAPPDREHPYGHRRFESFAATGVGLLLLFVAWDVLASATSRVLRGAPPPTFDNLALVVLGVTLAANLFVATWELRAGRRYQSELLVADAQHTRADVLVTLTVIGAVVAARLGFAQADLVAGVFVGLLVGVIGVRVLRTNLAVLADRAPLEAERILAVARAVPQVSSAYDARSRGPPGKVLVDLCIAVSADLTVGTGHEVAHQVEEALRGAELGIIDVVVHVEPTSAAGTRG